MQNQEAFTPGQQKGHERIHKAWAAVVTVFVIALILFSIIIAFAFSEADQSSGDQNVATDTVEQTDTPSETETEPVVQDQQDDQTDQAEGGDVTLYDGDFETYLMKYRYEIAASSACVRGSDFPTLGSQLIYPDDALEFGDQEMVDVLDRVFAREDAVDINTTLKEGPDDVFYDFICEYDEGNVAFFVTSSPGIFETEYQVHVLTKFLLNAEWEIEDGDTFTTDRDVYAYSDVDGSAISTVPVLWAEESWGGDMNKWDVYEIDTFFGSLTEIESCEVTSELGEKKIACSSVFESL